MKHVQTTLFGDKDLSVHTQKRKRVTYDDFVEKFKPKHTTDDCHTPPPVYDCVLSWLRKKVNIDGCPIVRPFFPGGDYINYNYPPNCVVVDNPPFSFLSKIIKFFIKKDIRFFLFSPHLTSFSLLNTNDITVISVGASVVYENGAKVPTSFCSNLFPHIAAFTASDLKLELGKLNEEKAKENNQYPNEICTISKLDYIALRGIDVTIKREECVSVRKLDAMREGKGLFGGALLLSAAATVRVNEAQIEAQIEAKRKKEEMMKFYILSEREKMIQKKLDENI